MKRAHLFSLCLSIAALGLGCGGNEASTTGAPTAGPARSGAATAAATSTATAAASGTAAAGPGCASVGCGDKEGDFFNKCDCKGKNMTPPLVAKYTGKQSGFDKEPTFEVENTSDKPLHWGSAAVYYYDKAGKQLEVELKDRKEKFKKYTINGSNFSLKAKEKKEISFGWKAESAPKDAARIEVVFDGWCYGTYEDKASHLCINIDRAPEDRPASN